MFTTLDSDFLFKLILNTFSISLLVLGCYMRGFFSREGGNKEHATSFILFAVGVFSVTNLLHSVDISMGFAFGLFAVFSMLRYRTESISVREMTYLFMVIAISLLSAVSTASFLELGLLHGVFVLFAMLCERLVSRGVLLEQFVQYEKIENITPENYPELLSDLKKRTGLNVIDVKITQIDFLKDSANLVVRYLPEFNEPLNKKLPTSSMLKVQ
ncbi:MAG: DUF4956 domain-containing protein [Bermanella sp.]